MKSQKPMRVLALCKYGRKGASSRLRTMQYYEPLLAEGIHLEIDCLLDDEYLDDKYSGKTNAIAVVKSYLRRMASMQKIKSYDLIHIEKEAFPWLPWCIEKILLPRSIPVSVDLDDAIFHNYDSHRTGIVRKILGNKIDKLMQYSSLVTTGSRYIQARAEKAGARRIEYIPTVVDAKRYKAKELKTSGPLTIGWIGSPSTTKYLRDISEPLTELSKKHEIEFIAVGADPKQLKGTPFKSVEWSEKTEPELVSSFDIGIMPLQSSPWELGKCAYKIIQYMAAGIPTVASPVGMNIEVIEKSGSGALAKSKHDWFNEIENLIKNPGARLKKGGAGRSAVETFYSTQCQVKKIANAWREIAMPRNAE